LFKELLFLALLIFIPPVSFAQLDEHTFESSIQEGQVYIIIQIQIRDSNGSFVGYIETDRITVTNLEALSEILDNMATNPNNTKIVTIDDKKYQVITGGDDAKYDSDTVVSMSLITRDGETIVYANHDGIPVRIGDSNIFIWTIVRPA